MSTQPKRKPTSDKLAARKPTRPGLWQFRGRLWHARQMRAAEQDFVVFLEADDPDKTLPPGAAQVLH